MTLSALLVLTLCAAGGLAASTGDAKYTLPKDFLLGGGISSYQTEGAWDAEGKGVNVFDFGYHSTGSTPNGDVASDTYGHYAEDIDIAAEIGFNVFRFSISWARIFPNGTNATINQPGVDHYHKVLDKLIEKKIEPIVTLFHFDHPQALETEFGGWLGDEMPDVFAAYADFAFKTYGEKVKYWLTVNEASWYCLALGSGMLYPKTYNTTARQNKCLTNAIVAHAKAHAIYHDKYQSVQKGMVGFGAGPQFARAANASSPEDLAGAEKSNKVSGIALTVDALVFGDFPEEAKKARNISFTDEEKKLIKGRVDFLGINVYGGTSVNASAGGGATLPPGEGGSSVPPGDGGSGGPPGDGNHPGGFGDDGSAWVLREMPKWIKARYEVNGRKLPIFITENGVHGDGNGTSPLHDWDERAVYCSAYLRELAAGINEDETRVFGYTLWSFVDTFEFHGFSNWGLVHVDFDSASLNRTKKDSWTFFQRVMQTRVVPLVEKGSTPFQPSGSAAFQSSAVISTLAILLLRWLQ
ncbi:hypothetical protein ONE63_009534 [Megalurothrips usitatus]|uniref:Myrosinase 1-like n=1 Tax=Megalurothrips usitatus TaxID=439358 RepID=A0AAV7XNI9_9NEOP|nr:hypothetical protein ONE63_009534 [Megalurothrips usitatus]